MTADPRAAILAALDADDQRARAATGGSLTWAVGPDLDVVLTVDRSSVVAAAPHGVVPPIPTLLHIAAHDPETVLRRNAGVRAVVEIHVLWRTEDGDQCRRCWEDEWPCPTIRAFADAYAPGWEA